MGPQHTLVPRAQELDCAGRLFQRLHVLNDIMRGVGSKYFLFPGAVRASNGFSQRALELVKEAWTAKDELRDARRRLRHARLFLLFRSWKTILQHHHRDAPGSPMDAMSELRKSKRNEALCLHLLRRKQLEKRSCLVYDRETHWREIANSAEAADKAGDARGTCSGRTTTVPGIKTG